MVNCWRIANGLWALAFMAQDSSDVTRKETVKSFRRFLRVERLKMLIGVPLAYGAAWFLVIAPLPGHSFVDMLVTYSALPPLGLVFGFPLILLPMALLVAAASYTVIGALFIVGWFQVRYLGFPR